jgi:transitional endoplasmic reticulum ATPase
VSQTNEILIQMEQFPGILIMATNFMNHQDRAALRRFDFKIRFDYFNAEQAHRLFSNSI